MTIRVAINGFGRIGRNVLRALYENQYREHIQVVAINSHDHESITVNDDVIAISASPTRSFPTHPAPPTAWLRLLKCCNTTQGL